MRNASILAVILSLAAVPAVADQAVVVHLPPKTPFAIKHPRLHSIGRRTRKIAIPVLKYVLPAVAQGAQIMAAVKH